MMASEDFVPGEYAYEKSNDISVISHKKSRIEGLEPYCEPPYAVELSKISENSVMVVWDGASADGTAITYMVSYRISGKNKWSKKKVESGKRCVLQNLENPALYEVRVHKVCYDRYTRETSESDSSPAGYIYLGTDDPCSGIKNIQIIPYNEHAVWIKWEGPKPDPKETRYVVRYKKYRSNDDWNEIFVFNDTQLFLSELEEDTEYQLQLKAIKGGSYTKFTETCDWVDVGVFESRMPLKKEENNVENRGGGNISCTSIAIDQNGFTIPSSTPVASSVQVGDVLTIGPFQMTLTDVTYKNQKATGQGTIVVPFGGKEINVQFTEISLNSSRQVFSGLITGISVDTSLYPRMLKDSINPALRICEPTVNYGFDDNGVYQPDGTSYDPRGFDENGNFANPPCDTSLHPGCNSQYDPYGFDKDGNYITGGKYSDEGCSRDGLDSLGNPCDPHSKPPYAYMDSTGIQETIDGNNLYNEHKDSIRAYIIAEFNKMKLEIQDSLADQRTICSGIRTTMNGYVTSLGYQSKRAELFGAGDVWLNEGMSETFLNRPDKQMINTNVKDANMDSLENNHIRLYDCDLEVRTLVALYNFITAHAADPKREGHIQDYIYQIKRMDSDGYSKYKLPAQIKGWIREQILALIESEFGDGGIGQNDQSTQKAANLPIPGQSLPDESLTASTTLMFYKDKNNRGLSDKGFTLNLQQDNELKLLVTEKLLADDKLFGTGSSGNGTFLPIEMKKEIAGRNYFMYVDNIRFTPSDAKADITCVVEMPFSVEKVMFRLRDMRFTDQGFDMSGKIELLSDVPVRLNNAAKLIFKSGSGNTYVRIDCDGITEMGINAEIEFCRDYVIPIDKTTKEIITDPNQHVKATFKIDAIASFSDIITTLTIDPFVINGAESMKWEIQEAYVDMSDLLNPGSMAIPANYMSPYASGGVLSGLWRGFYLKSLSVTMPKGMNKGSKPVSISAQNVIIDDMGFTGLISLANVMPLDSGSLGGWAYSIDTIQVGIVANKLTGGGFSGKINVPLIRGKNSSNDNVIDTADCFAYRAAFYPGDIMQFWVSSGSEYKINMLKASCTIKPTSVISVTYANGSVRADAILDGELAIAGNLFGSFNMSVPKMTFQRLTVSTVAPYLSLGTFSFPLNVGAKFGPFEMELQSSGMFWNDTSNKGGLNLSCMIQISESSTKIGAYANFNIVGEMQTYGTLNRKKWVYKEVQFNEVTIKGSFPGVGRIEGSLVFFREHATFGTGFRGILSAQFDALPVDVTVLGQFGTKDSTYKYFMVDALVFLDKGINMAGFLSLKGFGGGIYHHMERDETSVPYLVKNSSQFNLINFPLGSSLSGIQYTPNQSKGLGFRALVVMTSAGSERVLTANVALQMEFNTGGGLDKIWFEGIANFMSDLKFDVPTNKLNITGRDSAKDVQPTNDVCLGALTAYLMIKYDNSKKALDATFALYINNQQQQILTGPNGQSRIGQVALHIDPTVWYLYVGTPKDPVGLQVNILNVLQAQLTAYFDVGTKIPAMNTLPSKVANLTGASGPKLPSEFERNSGKGFAFGFTFDLRFDAKFAIFYASLEVGLGFDLMLKEVKSSLCDGQSYGLNGWYAAGQGWAYVSADIGIKVGSRSYSIINFAGGVVLQAKLPNPFVAKGYVGGSYRILFGAIKGNCKFEFTIGKDCQEMAQDTSGPLGTPVITATMPDNGGEISTLEFPSVSFATQLNTFYTYEAPNVEGEQFIITLDSLSLKCLTHNVSIPVEYGYSPGSSRYDKIELKPFIMLPANDSFEMKVKVRISYFNHTFPDQFEYRTVKFYTGGVASNLPPENIHSTYPVNGMANYYKEEFKDYGFIKLRRWQGDLLETTSIRLALEDSLGQRTNLAYEFDVARNAIKYKLNSAALTSGSIYTIKVIKIDERTEAGGENSEQSGNTINGNKMENVLYKMQFRVSTFNKFVDKINSYVTGSTAKANQPFTPSEPFDYFELNDGENIDRSVRISIDAGFPWIDTLIKPLVYNKALVYYVNYTFNLYNGESDYDIAELPQKALTIYQSPSSYLIADGKYNTERDNVSAYISNDLFEQIRKDIQERKMALRLFYGICSDKKGNMNNAINKPQNRDIDYFNVCFTNDWVKRLYNYELSVPVSLTIPAIFEYYRPGIDGTPQLSTYYKKNVVHTPLSN